MLVFSKNKASEYYLVYIGLFYNMEELRGFLSKRYAANIGIVLSIYGAD